MPAAPTHLLLDFFGTVVEYAASGTARDYERTHDLTVQLGSTRTYDETRALWSAAFDRLEGETAHSLEEFSAVEVARLALEALVGRAPTAGEAQAAAVTYDEDWNRGIHYPAGVLAVLEELSDEFTLAIVSNTHSVDLVQSHLRAMGAARYVEVVVTSIDVGRRKPHPEIFERALDRLGVSAAGALFVGDTLSADFLGPERCGIRAYLIDPLGIQPVPADRRLRSLHGLASRLREQDLLPGD